MFVGSIRRAAQIAPMRPATRCSGRTRSWADSVDRTSRLGAALLGLGVASGAKIGILAQNSDRYIEAIHAAWWIGAAIAPMNNRWALPEHVVSAGDVGMSIIFVDSAHAEIAVSVQHAVGSVRHLINMDTDDDDQNSRSFERLIATHAPCEARPADDGALAGIFFTGGTTGRPKGVMHSARSLWATCLAGSYDMRVPDAVTYLHAPPMFHLGGLAPALSTTALAGTHVFLPAFRPELVFAAVREHGVQYMAMVPTMLAMLFDDPAFKPADFDSLEVVLYGGGATSERLRDAMRTLLPHVRFQQGFGQSEVAGSISTMPHKLMMALDEADPRRGSAGLVCYGSEIKIVDSDGNRLASGDVGELCVRTAGAMLGYYNRPEETARSLIDGWIHTGDAGYVDRDGYIYVCDRIKDVIRSGGENIFSAEVENAITAHPAVAAVAVIAVPDDHWEERVHAVVVARTGHSVTIEALQGHCRTLIAGYKIPRSLDLVDALPLSPQGKVLKATLREPYWRGRKKTRLFK